MTETHKEMDVKPWEWVEGEHGYSTLCDADNNEIITTGGYNDGDYPVVWMGEEMTDEHKELIALAPFTKARYDALLSAYSDLKEENARLREALAKVERITRAPENGVEESDTMDDHRRDLFHAWHAASTALSQKAEGEALPVSTDKERVEKLEAGYTNLLTRYLALANSGDCGFWDPEQEAAVIEARALLETEGK